MAFTLIRGTYRLVGKKPNGSPRGFEPDGDSVQFKPNKPALLKKLTLLGKPIKPSSIGSVNLRLEGIDALELHLPAQVKGGHPTHQPRPMADDARDFLTKELGLDPVHYVPPKKLQVQPPAPHDGASGYILSRSVEANGRPVSFLFTGTPTALDGASVVLTPALLKKSFNYKAVLNGFAYPLYYDTLFKQLRDVLTSATLAARKNKLGIWAKDRSLKGVSASKLSDLETGGFIFPKLFRRLASYFDSGNQGLAKFLALPELKKEQVQDLDPNSPTFTNFTHFDNMVRVAGNKVFLKQHPETLLFVSQKKP